MIFGSRSTVENRDWDGYIESAGDRAEPSLLVEKKCDRQLATR